MVLTGRGTTIGTPARARSILSIRTAVRFVRCRCVECACWARDVWIPGNSRSVRIPEDDAAFSSSTSERLRRCNRSQTVQGTLQVGNRERRRWLTSSIVEMCYPEHREDAISLPSGSLLMRLLPRFTWGGLGVLGQSCSGVAMAGRIDWGPGTGAEYTIPYAGQSQ